MRGLRGVAQLLVLTVVLTGCYHQVVRTGATAGGTVIERPWTATYLFGLVPASTIETASECPAGVAVVETQQTAVNGVVGALTLGIYTPQTVTITCAAAGGAAAGADTRIDLPADADLPEWDRAIRDAIGVARESGETVLVGGGLNP